MASKFSVEKTSTTPAAAGEKLLSKDDAPQTEAETEERRVTPYWEAVGALTWAAAMTRPDVAHAAHQLGKINGNLGPAHWKAAKRALQYLWRTKDVGITYGGTPGSCTKFRHEWTPISPLALTLGVRFPGGAVILGGGGGDQLVLEGAEGDRSRAIRIRVCSAGRSCR